MKKVIVLLVIIIFVAYIVYQNGSTWILKLLSLSSGSVHNTASSGSSSVIPPYKNGAYTGSVDNAFYGNIQVQAIIQNGKISDVQFLQYPSDRARSMAINTLAMPNLKQEAIIAQNANVNIISGATDTSNAFAESLSSALTQAK